MKKRRVLALLMALSLAVSTNGMTVFATEAGELTAPVVSLVEGSTDDVQDGTEQADAAEDDADDEQDIDSEDTDQNKENDGDSTEDQIGKDDDGTNDGEPSDVSGENDSDEQDSDAEDAGDETTLENTLPNEEEPVEEKREELPKAIKHEVRMMTFTDDTGMQISYDANASQQYVYEVENGVLLSVKTKEAVPDVSGNTIEVLKPVEFEGNVELKQPEEGEKYTSIAETIFGGNKNITYVKLPDGVTGIGDNTFKDCTGLKGVYLPKTVTSIGISAFESCTSMTQIAVPKAVTTIGNSAFKNDARLYMVYMKDVDYSCLEKIGAHAFDKCTALEAFCADTKFLLPTSLEEIGAYAFNECVHIKTVNLETGALKAMGEYAFADCIGLTDAVMSKTMAVIPQYAFYGCTALASLKFESKSGQWVKIDEHAFEGCYGLTSLVLPGTISEVADFAFAGCTNLCRVEVKNDNLIIGKTQAFPVGETRSTLQFIGRPGSTTYEYCRGKSKVEFIEDTQSAAKKYYKYIVKDSNGVECEDGKVPGGQIWIGPTDKTRYEDNINTLKDDKGNVAGVQPDDTKQYRVYLQAEKSYSLVPGSLRANGEVLQAEKGAYYVTMPVGGIVITAAFSKEGSETVNGRDGDIVVEYSNGEPIDNGVEIKMGQTTRIFLIDKSGTPISASKIENIESSSTVVAKVSKSGVVTAAGAGTAIIKIVLLGGDGKEIILQSKIKVVEADADVMKLKATAYDSAFEITGDQDGIQTASIDKSILRDEALTITLKANAYTVDKERIAKEFTWTSSDTRVVKLKASTTGGDATNILEVQKGCEGEATITVTAKNKKTSSSPKDLKETVTQKFVVSVQSTTGRLASSSITVNPNLIYGGELEVLLAYGAGLDPSKTALYEQSKDSQGKTIYLSSLKFTCELSGESAGKSYRYYVKPAEGTGEGTYKLFVGLNGVTPNADTLLPLTIKVAKAAPAPTVKFNTKKTKFNLFYKNGGVDKEGNPITVTTEITKLGTAKIVKCELEPLSGKEDDQKFINNFEIISRGMESGKYTVVIRKKNENLQYTNTKEKKPVVTGYLALYYEGYEDSAAKKVKVTMPTCTTAPSYSLRETKATYRKDGPMQELTLVLYDKKSKTKEQVKLDAGVDTVTEEQNAFQLFGGTPSIQEDGTVVVKFMPESGGKLKLALTNQKWDLDKNGKPRTLTFTYTVNVSREDPTVKADKSTVSLNLSKPDEAISFSLIPSQRGVELDPRQDFAPAVYKDGIENLEVTYENGEGLAKIKEGKTVKAGTYKFECYPQSADWPGMKKVTLNVKVVDNKPTVKLGKGTLQLNLMVHKNNADSGVDNAALYRETASVPFTIKGKPEGYEIANVGTDDQSTIITTSAGNIEKHFDFRIKPGDPIEKIDDMLEVSLLDNALSVGTYTFTMTQRYVRENRAAISAKPMTFKVKVYSNNDITLKVAAKGKINLVNRRGEANEKNGILYTPTLKNIKGEILDVKIFEAGTDGFEESRHFDASLIKEGKNKGKIYVTPKVTAQSGIGGTGVTYEYAELDNNKVYPVRVWVQVDGYAGTPSTKNGVMSQTIQIKTAQVLPKVTADKSTLNVYLATKEYDASFTVKPKENSVGEIEKIYFGEKDEKAKDSFELIQQPQEDGSMKVIIHLKEAVGFENGSTNNIKMYVKYKGQGANTSENATAFTMKIKVN